jgi:hypothetical protein
MYVTVCTLRHLFEFCNVIQSDSLGEQLMDFLNMGCESVAYPGILFGGGGSTNSFEDRGQRERGSGGSSPPVRGSGGRCNLVQEISFRIVNFS